MMTETAKRFPPPQVVEGSWDYYDIIQPLCDLRYGTGYMTREVYAHWMEHPDMIQIALVDGQFAGYSSMLPVTLDEVVTGMKVNRSDAERIAGGRPILYYKSTVVPFEYEGRGHFQALAHAAMATAREQGYGSMFSTAWTYGGYTPLARPFARLGFEHLYRRSMLWYEDKNYTCIVCKGPCRCDAELYYKKLWGEQP